MAKAGFPVKAELLDLLGFEKAHDDADSFRSPTGDLAVKPIARARAIGMIAKRTPSPSERRRADQSNEFWGASLL